MKGVVVITGVSAAGKSTVAQALAERLPRAAHVRGDVFRRMVVAGRAEMTPEAGDEAVRQLRLRYRLAAATADMYFDAGFTAIVQDVIIGGDLQRFTKNDPFAAAVCDRIGARSGRSRAPRGRPRQVRIQRKLDDLPAGRRSPGRDPTHRPLAGYLPSNGRGDR
ncbi:AAA family ATPase [Nonomuraea salmonea]|uniref:AAA family ATPase n=1 Tax=Nonomuraea salmonea TaxID=46181 RepID=UPI0031ED0DA3